MRTIREAAERAQRRTTERNRGVPVSPGLRMSSSRTAESLILSPLRLPCVASDEALQDEEGNFLYRPDFSDPAGPDIGAPGG